jgi:hypothetical protein
MAAAINRKYYVYVYIDPRNHEEFYYGKGCGSRSTAHLTDTDDSDKAQRIQAIKDQGQSPIIKIIAAGLTEHDAHLIETTLIWKLGRNLTNLAAGRHSSLFRPHNTLHKQISGFDFQNAIYYFNVAEGSDYRRWEECQRLGFLSAGGGKQWRDQVLDIFPGDVLVAYLKGHGYVGVGKVIQGARPYREVRVKGNLLGQFGPRTAGMAGNADDLDKCEYPIIVDWVATVPRSKAKWKAKSGLYSTQLVKASLDNQQTTIRYIEAEFKVKLDSILR